MISTHSRSSQLRTARARASRAGFSLIEVAIALVIFVIGALAIIRIFPGALSVIGNNGNQQIATNLNRSVLVAMQSEQVTATPLPNFTPAPGLAAKTEFNALPDATFNNSNADSTLNISSWTTPNSSLDHSGDFKDTNSSVVGVPRINETLPDTQGIETGDSLSALSRYRVIIGEKARVIDLNRMVSGIPNASAQYALTQFPISVQKQGNPLTLLPVEPIISQEFLLNDVRTKPDGTLDFSRCRLEDSDDTAAPLTANAGSMLYVSYRYYNALNNIWGVRDEAIPTDRAIPTGAPSVDLRTTALKVQPPTATVRPDAARTNGGLITDAIVPEVIAVKWRNNFGQGDFGPAPSSVLTASQQVADARRGLIRLPVGLSTTRPVIVDYVADWSFLLRDGVPSNPTTVSYPAFPPSPPAPINLSYRQIALGTPYIEDQTDVSLYSLLIEGNDAYVSGYGLATDPTSPPEYMPEPLAINRMVRATDTNNPQQREDELRAGKVTFIVDQDSPVRARVAYQTRDNWVQQLSVGASAYKPFRDGNAEPWRDYGLGNDGYLYFHASEAGKTISVSYSITNANGPLADRPFVIQTSLVNAAGNVPTNFIKSFYGKPGDTAQVARVRLTNAAGGDLNPNELLSIQAVKGISITSRTAYINGTKYAQKIDTTTRGANS